MMQVLGAPLGYFESTPVGRLVQVRHMTAPHTFHAPHRALSRFPAPPFAVCGQRFSKDLDAIDQQLPNSLGQLLASSITIVASMVGITLVTPSFGALMVRAYPT